MGDERVDPCPKLSPAEPSARQPQTKNEPTVIIEKAMFADGVSNRAAICRITVFMCALQYEID